MEQATSRLENDVLYWRQREQRHINTSGSEVLKNKHFLKEKLAYYEVLELKYRKPTNLDDRLTMAIVKDKRRELERQLYPGLITRLLYRAVKAAFAGRMEAKYMRADQGKLTSLSDRLSARGFSNLQPQIEKQINLGLSEFSIPVTHHFNDRERVDFKLDFQRDKNGDFDLVDCKARLKSGDGPPTGFISLTKNNLEQVNVRQAYNLLSGRSVHVEGNWLQLDFNDKDAASNFRTKVFPQGFGYDIEEEVSRLNLKESHDPVQMQQLVEGLKNGDKMQATEIGKSKVIELEPNAHKKTVLSAGKDNQVGSQDRGAKVIPFTTMQKGQRTSRKTKIT